MGQPDSNKTTSMKATIKKSIQILVARTSFFPLNFVYSLIYRLAVRAAVMVLRRVPGTVSIYLRRGVAKKEIVYGLSDIDLLVVVKGDAHQESAAKGRVRVLYRRLSRLLPLFGDIEQELGLYSLEEFNRLFRDYPFYQYRFHCGRTEWRLLCGQDILTILPEVPSRQLRLAATEEIKVWWTKILELMQSEAPENAIFARYFWYKAISESAKISSFIRTGRLYFSRKEALNWLKDSADAPCRGLIARVAEYAKKLESRERLPVDELTGLFISLADAAVTNLVLENRLDASKSAAVELTMEMDEPRQRANLLQPWKGLRMVVSEVMGERANVVFFPCVEFSPDVLSNGDVDTTCLVVIATTLPTYGQIAELQRQLRESATSRFEPYLAYQDIAFSLLGNQPVASVKNAAVDRIFFSLVKAATHSPVEEQQSCLLPAGEFWRMLKSRLIRVKAALEDRDIYKLVALDFARFFWSAARTGLLHRQEGRTRMDLPITSRQIKDGLSRHYPDETDWLGQFYFEYNRALMDENNECFRHYTACVSLLRRLTQESAKQ